MTRLPQSTLEAKRPTVFAGHRWLRSYHIFAFAESLLLSHLNARI
jgi:hypothetical protein